MVRNRREHPARDREVEAASGMPLEPAGHNEDKPHPMSIESSRTREPSPYPTGEGCQEESRQPSRLPQRSGGVSGDSMLGKAGGKTREACEREAGASTAGATSPKVAEAGTARTGVGVLHSSEDASERRAEQRRGSCADAQEAARERSDGPKGIGTLKEPEKVTGVRKLQRALYRQAKKNPKWKAWSLYGELTRGEILEEAIWKVIANGGAPGIDGFEVEILKDDGLRERWQEKLASELKEKRYRPSAVQRVYIPKADGKQRPLAIPTVKDRVVQAAVVLLIQPIFEADFHENSFAYRPKRHAQQAMGVIQKALLSGRREVVDADLSGYFDTIPHKELLQLVRGRVSDGSILRLIKGWLRAPIVERDPVSGAQSTRKNRCGTPQGGVISPLLANLYLDGLDKAVNRGSQMKAIMVRYADDFVVLCRKGQGQEMKRRLEHWLRKRKLTLNEKKTRVVDFEKESFEFLGFRLSWRISQRGKRYPHCEPSPESCGDLRKALREETRRSTLWKPPEVVFVRVNQITRGWISYFHYGHSPRVFTKVQYYVRTRMKRWLWHKHGRSQALFGPAYADETLHESYGLTRFPQHIQRG